MKRSAWFAFVALLTSLSCKDDVDLGGTNPDDSAGVGGEDSPGAGGEGALDASGGTSGAATGGAPTGGRGGSPGGRGGATSNGGDAGVGTGGVAGVGGSTPPAGAAGDGNLGGAGAGVGGAGAGGVSPGGSAGSGGSNMVGGAGSGSGLCDQSAAADFCRPCVGSSAGLVHACILDAGGQPITASFDASVIVVSVDEAPFDACTAATGTASAPSSRLVVEASDQTRWTVVLGMPDLPPSFAEPTDNLELSVVASPRVHIFDYADQTIKLWRSNTLVAFAAMATFNDITGLADTGIAFLGGEERCRYPGIGCTVIMRSTRLSAGGMESVFLLGETRVLGPFSITVDEAYGYQSNGSCDGVSTRQIAGFALPP